MITGEKVMIYLGVVLMLLGTYIIIADSLNLTPSIVMALGGFIFSMGLIISYVGFKGKESRIQLGMPGLSEANARYPLGYLGAATERSKDNQKKSSGYKALGFVLISIGVFALAVDMTVLVSLFLSPLGIFGIVCLSFGIFFNQIIFEEGKLRLRAFSFATSLRRRPVVYWVGVALMAMAFITVAYYVLNAATIQVTRKSLPISADAMGIKEKDLGIFPSLRHAIDLADKNYDQNLGDETAIVKASIIEGSLIFERYNLHKNTPQIVILSLDGEIRAYLVRVDPGW